MRFDAEARRHGEKRGEETEVGKDGQHAFAAVVPGGSGDRRGNRGGEAALLFRPGLDFAAETLVAVLHALFDRGPDLRVAALPFRHGFVPEVGQVGDAHFAGEKAADREIAEAGEEGGPAAVGGGGTGGPGDAVEDLLLPGRRGSGEILLKETRRFQVQPGESAEHSGGEVLVAILARAEVQPVVDKLGDAGGGGAAGVFVGGDSFEALFNSKGVARWHRETLAQASVTMQAEDSSGWQK